MSGYRLTPKARQDLADIWDYTKANWGEAQADRYIRGVVAVCRELATGKRRGRSAEDIKHGYRRCAVGSHILFFRQDGEGLVIVRVLHGRMDPKRRL